MSRSERAIWALTSEEEVRRCLRVLYTKMLGDRMVGFFFEGRDLEPIVEGQLNLVRAVLGGPGVYGGVPLPEAHRALPLLPGHFDRRHTLLAEVLATEGVHEKVKAAWLEADAAWRKAILAAGAEARDRVREAQDSDEAAPSSG